MVVSLIFSRHFFQEQKVSTPLPRSNQNKLESFHNRRITPLDSVEKGAPLMARKGGQDRVIASEPDQKKIHALLTRKLLQHLNRYRFEEPVHEARRNQAEAC
jgi:hypothetical protein